MSDATPAAIRILIACTGNICRSPLAALILEDRLGAWGVGRVQVISGGLGAPIGYPMDPKSAEEARRRGLDPAHHRSRAVTAADVRDAALVIGLTAEHRGRLARLDPSAVSRCLTLKEAGILSSRLDEGPEARSPAASRQIDALLAQPRHGLTSRRQGQRALDIQDPFRKSARVHRKVADEIDRAVSELARWIVPGQ